MRHKSLESLTALLIAGLLLLSGCDKTPSEVSEGDMPQSEAVSETINSENTSSTEDEASVSGETSEEPSEAEISIPDGYYTTESFGEGKISLLKMPGKKPGDGDLYTIADAQGKLLFPFQFNRAEKLGTEETEYVALYTEVNSFLYTADGKEVPLPYGEYSRYVYVNGAVAAYNESTKSYLLIDADGNPYKNIPGYQEYYPEYPINGMVISYTWNNKTNNLYLRFAEKGRFDVCPYNKDEKNAAERKNTAKILEAFNFFILAAQKGNYSEMRNYATSELLRYEDVHLVGIGGKERKRGLCLPKFLEVLVKDEHGDPELAKKQQLELDELHFIYIDDTNGGHSEALFYFPEVVIVGNKPQLQYSEKPYKLSVVCDGNGGFKVEGIWRDYDADKKLLPTEESKKEPLDYFEEYRKKYSWGVDMSIKHDKKASIIRGYMGSEYGVVDANSKVLYRCIYDSARYYGYETPDIIILSDWEMKETHVLDAWGKEIEFKGDGEYTRFSYLNGAILAYDEKTELYTLFRVDGTPYENIPSFKTVQHFPTAALAITYTENGVEKGAYLKFTDRRSFELVPYGKAEKQAAEDKYRKKIIGVFNSFTDALRSGDKQEMLKYATEDLVYHAVTGCDGGGKDPNHLKNMLAYDIPESIERQRVDPNGPVFFYIDDSKGGISECFFMMLRYIKDYGYEEPFDGEPIGLTFVCDGNGGFKLDTIDVYCQEDTGLLFERSQELKEKENKK